MRIYFILKSCTSYLGCGIKTSLHVKIFFRNSETYVYDSVRLVALANSRVIRCVRYEYSILPQKTFNYYELNCSKTYFLKSILQHVFVLKNVDSSMQLYSMRPW